MVLNPLLFPSRYTAYLSVNRGAPVPSIHCAKNEVNCCWLCDSATFTRSCVRIELSVYWLRVPLRISRKALLPTSPRSIWKTIGALFKGHGLELRRERSQPAHARQRGRVVRQRPAETSSRSCIHCASAAIVLQKHQLAVARHAICNPGVAQRARTQPRIPTTDAQWYWPAAWTPLCRPLSRSESPPVPEPTLRAKVSSGTSITFKWLVSGSPKLSVKKSYSLVAICASWFADAWWLMLTYTLQHFPRPPKSALRTAPQSRFQRNPGFFQLKVNSSPGLPLLKW